MEEVMVEVVKVSNDGKGNEGSNGGGGGGMQRW